VTVARTWDAATYHRVSGAMEAMNLAVLDRLPLTGAETVLDAGCGSGRITAALAERLPAGRVVGVDADPGMVAQARAHLARFGDRVDLRVGDLLDLAVDPPVDAVFSTATFHWILDHERLFARLHAALRPGGALVAQCGGAGNIAAVLAAADAVAERDAYAPHLRGFCRPHRFATPEETTALLEAAGFRDVRCWLTPNPVVPDEPLAYLRTVGLGAHVDRLPGGLRDPFVAEAAALLGDPVTVDYVRLNLDATA
jgi:trans-aconitate 2-methyltransferase